MKICVYAICKNEEKFVERWMDSMGEADAVVVTDTGSTDGTVAALRRRGAAVHVEEISPWRFDAARNVSLRHVPEDMDICVSTDLDEYFDAGWRKALEGAWRADIAAQPGPAARIGRYLYNWSLKPDGSPDVQFNITKAHDRRGFRWKHPVHEHIEYREGLPLRTLSVDGMVLNHTPDSEKSRGSYLPLLELAVREDPDSDRMRYYLGREYLYRGAWRQCADTLAAYLALPSARWNEERSAAMRWMAKAFSRLGRVQDARVWYLRAIAEAPHMRDPLVEYSMLLLEQRDWPMAFAMAETALRIREKSPTYVNMGYAWDATPDDLCAVAAYRMGMKGRAVHHARQALALAPGDARLQKNLRLAEELPDSGVLTP